jgi:sulfate/thiosulfate transport system substrate-binding protein
LTRFRSSTTRSLAVAGTAAVAALAIAACGGSSDSTGGGGGSSTSGATNAKTTLNLVAYSTPQTAFDALTKDFAKTSAGKGVAFQGSFGSSGSQSKAVAAGQAADVVSFSTTPDMTRLVSAGLVSKDWNQNPEQGFSSNSVVVFVVRKGNPDHITTWNDLLKKGITVVTPNPATSGSARWNILAGYGAVLKQGGTKAQALAYTKNLITNHVTEEDSSASEALDTFTSGKGDVLLDYESDAIAAERAGDKVSYVIPKQTILIQTPIAVDSKTSHKAQADAFLKYQWSTAGQTVWAQQGYRPVLASVAAKFKKQFPTPPQLFKIGYLGGWSKASTLFAPSTGAITKIEQEAGFPTASS